MKRVFGGLVIAGGVVAIVLAAFRGLVPEELSDLDKPSFLVVQETFEEWRNRYDCASMDSGISALQPYLSDTELLPGDQIQSVTLPKTMTKPTIGDLALDRTIRLQSIRKQLCP
jgi:hypothetical protein